MRCLRARTCRLARRQSMRLHSVGRPGPFAEAGPRIQLSPDFAFFTALFGSVTWSTSAPFRDGPVKGPIQPVMSSRCLSAAGLRFLDHPLPTGASDLSCEDRTDQVRPQWGSHVPHDQASTGVGAFYTPGAWCPCHGACVNPGPLTMTGSVMHLPQPCRLDQPSCPTSPNYGASTKIHLRSPVQSFPCPGSPDDSPCP